MSPVYRTRGSFWRQWPQLLVFCVVILASNLLTIWIVDSRIPTAADLAAELDAKAQGGGMGRGREDMAGGGAGGPGGQRAGGAGGGPGGQRPAGAAEGEDPGTRPGRAGGPGATPGAGGTVPMPGPSTEEVAESPAEAQAIPATENPVARLDRMLSARIERVATENGVALEQALPSQELRDAAIATGNLGSDEAQKLITEYSSLFRELTGEDAPAQ